MKFRVRYTKEAASQIRKLDKTIKERIRRYIERLADHPELGKRLTGLLGGRWSYRAGDWRILYKVFKGELVVLILTVGHRRDFYNR